MRPVVVWGNCQAEPVATLLAPVLRRHGLEIVPTAPVYRMTPETVGQLHETLAGAGALITQPIRDEYEVPGCGSGQLARLLPADAALVTFPITYDTSLFPYQVHAHRGNGSRIDAPLTDYHDLRMIVAAERGLTVEQTLAWWPAPDPAAVRAHHLASIAEMTRREKGLDVTVSDLLPQALLYTMTHPANHLLGAVTGRVLRALGFEEDVTLPQREFLGARRTPVEAAVTAALGLPATRGSDTDWVIDGRAVPLRETVTAQLPFYAAHPDIVADTRTRFADRLELLGL